MKANNLEPKAGNFIRSIKASRLIRYYQQQQRLGSPPLVATIKLPQNMFLYYQRMKNEGHQIYGYGRFDLPLLASYSRSGTNLLRYIIESISGRPTPGQVRVYHGINFIIDRAHKAYPVMDRYPKVILLLRDYRECLLRHNEGLWMKLQNVESFLQDTTDFQQPNWYIENLAAFDKFARPKLLIYYEQLLDDPKPLIRKLAAFLECDPVMAENFIGNMDTYFQNSIGEYTRRGHKSATQGKKDFRYHARKHLTLEQQKQFDVFYASRYPELYRCYLEQYRVIE